MESDNHLDNVAVVEVTTLNVDIVNMSLLTQRNETSLRELLLQCNDVNDAKFLVLGTNRTDLAVSE
jgi:hypothetical protein